MALQDLQSRISDHRCHRVEVEVRKQPPKSLFGACEIAIVTKRAESSSLQPWLCRIDFPGVKVEHSRPTFGRIYLLYSPSCPPIGQDTEVSATRNRQLERS